MPEFGCRPGIKKAVNLWEHRLILETITIDVYYIPLQNLLSIYRFFQSELLKYV